MPWTIWPALAILWGVFWMYRLPIDDQFLPDWDVMAIATRGLNMELTQHDSFLYTTITNDPVLSFIPAPEQYDEQNRLRPSPLPSSCVLESYGLLSDNNFDAETLPLQGTIDEYPAISAKPSPAIISGAHDDGQQRANLAGDSQYNGNADDPVVTPVFGRAAQAEHSNIPLGSASSSNCREHVAKREKRHKCHIDGCKSFGSKGDLRRHIKTVHNREEYFCDEEGCKRGRGKRPFGRKDNLRDHQRRIHGRDSSPSRHGLRQSSAVQNYPASNTSLTALQPVEELAPSKRKRQRQSFDGDSASENVQMADREEVPIHNPLEGASQVDQMQKMKNVKLEQKVKHLAAELEKEKRIRRKHREEIRKMTSRMERLERKQRAAARSMIYLGRR